MTCRTCRTSFADHLEGVLPPRRAAKLEEHVARCAACAAGLEEERRLTLALGSLAEEPLAGRDLWPAIAARLAREQRAGTPRSVWDALFSLGLRLVPACAAVLLLSLGLSLYQAGRLQRSTLSLRGDLQAAPATIVASLQEPTANDLVSWLTVEKD